MGFRYYDWECPLCSAVFPALTWVDFDSNPPAMEMRPCTACGAESLCSRRISCPAPYRGEAQWHPMVAGGSFDTMGVKPTRALPQPTQEQLGDVGALREHFRSPEWRDAKAQRAEQRQHNALKRKRTALAQQGKTFNLRRSEDRLPGDPKI